MPTVDDDIIIVKTKHNGVKAIMHSYWESWSGFTEISFNLMGSDGFLRTEKSFTPKSEKYIKGMFDKNTIINDYKDRFKKWLIEVNNRKHVSIK